MRDLLGYSALPPVDCSNEIKIEIQRLDAEIRFIKGELAGLNQRAELTEQDIVLLNQDMAQVDRIMAEVRKIFC